MRVKKKKNWGAAMLMMTASSHVSHSGVPTDFRCRLGYIEVTPDYTRPRLSLKV